MREPVASVLLVAAIAAFGCAARQNVPLTPLQLSIAGGARVFAEETPVRGISLNAIHGAQEDVIGLVAGPLNEVGKRLTGIGFGVMTSVREDVTGLMAGMGNSAGGALKGLQLGVANHVDGDIAGGQLGVANFAIGGSGFQTGLVNSAESMKGLQIGLLNYNDAAVVPFLPFVNFNFREKDAGPPAPAETLD